MAEKKQQPNRHARRSIAATRRKYAESLGLESAENPVVAFEGLDGNEYSFTHPMYMDEETEKVVSSQSEEVGQEERVRALLGDEQYERYTAHPGHLLVDVMLEFGEAGRDARDVMGDGTPTRPSTS